MSLEEQAWHIFGFGAIQDQWSMFCKLQLPAFVEAQKDFLDRFNAAAPVPYADICDVPFYAIKKMPQFPLQALQTHLRSRQVESEYCALVSELKQTGRSQLDQHVFLLNLFLAMENPDLEMTPEFMFIPPPWERIQGCSLPESEKQQWKITLGF